MNMAISEIKQEIKVIASTVRVKLVIVRFMDLTTYPKLITTATSGTAIIVFIPIVLPQDNLPGSLRQPVGKRTAAGNGRHAALFAADQVFD